MRLLLDTHVFLWYILNDPRLTADWRIKLRDPGNAVFLSAVSIWEACVKFQLGKLPLPDVPSILFVHQRVAHRIDPLPLSEECVRHLLTLPPIHKDPFDRILICQAIELGCQLVTDDASILSYPAPVLPL